MDFEPGAVETALLTRNYFPRVSKRGNEFPPCFVSDDFTIDVSSELNRVSRRRRDGYGVIVARSTRYDLAPRSMEIPHPRAYAALCRHLQTHWSDWKRFVTSESSAIRIAKHEDGRIFSMVTSRDADQLTGAGSRFRAQVDITNFYGSIYTHSLPWAIHGVEKAKETRRDNSEWSNELDKLFRNCRRTETTGISVGPGTSAIAGEILLGKVDAVLEREFRFVRHIDDYVFIARKREDAERFIRTLRSELASLHLSVHPVKTSITELPRAWSPRWLRRLRNTLRAPRSMGAMLDAIDEVIEITDENSEDGILQYLLVSIERVVEQGDVPEWEVELVVDRLLHVAYLRPIVVGTVCRLLDSLGSSAVEARAAELDSTLEEHASAHRTDAATWILWTLIRHGVSLSGAALESVMDSRDCLMLAVLAEDSAGRSRVAGFIEELELESPPDYRRDEYWLLYYQLARVGAIETELCPAYFEDLQPLLDARATFVDMAAANVFLPYHSGEALNPSFASSGARRVIYE